MKNIKKSPRASKKPKKVKEGYEDKLFVWFTVSIFLLVLIALAIFFINKIERKNLQDEFVADVNGEKITSSELDKWYKMSVVPEYRNIVKKEDFLAESLIPQKILLQEAEKNKIKASKDEIDNDLGQFLIDSGLSLDDFEKKLKEDAINLEYIKEAFKQRIMINKFLNQSILSKVNVSDFEVNEIYENTTSLDPSLSSGEIKQVIKDQLTTRKQNKALKEYIEQLIGNADIELFIDNKKIASFSETKDEICRRGGKPIIRLYTTSSCEPCRWISSRFDNVINEYVDDDKITAYHWDIDTGDNVLTKEIEKGVPRQEIEIFKKYNHGATVPTYVFGCRYVRVGNFYEQNNDLDSEENEFRAVVEKLLS